MPSFTLNYPAPAATISPTLTAYGTFSLTKFWTELLKNVDPGATAAFEKKFEKNKALTEQWAVLKKAGASGSIPDDFRTLVASLPLVCVLKCNNNSVETVNVSSLYCSDTLWKATFAPRTASPTDVYRFEAVLTGGTNSKIAAGLTVSEQGLQGTAIECGSSSDIVALNAQATRAAAGHSSGDTVVASNYPRNPRVKSCQCVIFQIVRGFPVIWGVIPGAAAFGRFEVLVPIPVNAPSISYLADVLLLDEDGIALYPAYRVTFS